MLSGCYHIPHVNAFGELVYTNNAWGGAARGAGPPQMNFALESAVDMLARKMGKDPLEFRLLNPLQPGFAMSTFALELDPDGGLTVYGSAADPGEGNDAMLTQLAAHAMGVPVEKIRLVTRDTDRTPDSSSASGSRATYMSGCALPLAVEALKKARAEAGATTYQDVIHAGKPVKYLGTRVQQTSPLDPECGQGIPYESRVHGV